MVRIVVGFLLSLCVLAPPSFADAFKKVRERDYQERAPLDNYVFATEGRVHVGYWATGKPSDLPGLKQIRYKPDMKHPYDYDQFHTVIGVLDERGRRPRWLLEPKYHWITRFSETRLAARFRDRQTGKLSLCLISVDGGDCEPTGMTSLFPPAQQQVPDWVNPVFTWRDGDFDGARDIGVYDRNGTLLFEVDNVAWERDDQDRQYAGAGVLDDGLILRARKKDGAFVDIVYTPYADGGFAISELPPFSRYENDETQYRMFTADVELGLVWPLYAIEGGFREAPYDLLGIKPLPYNYAGLSLTHLAFRNRSSFGVGTAAVEYCCKKPSGWAVAWDTADGIRYAVLPTPKTPHFEDIMASRPDAHYTDIRPLWQFGQDDNNTTQARQRGEISGHYVMLRDNGMAEVYDTYSANTNKYRRENKTDNFFKLEASMPQSQLEGWVRTEQAKIAELTAAALERYKQQEKAAERAKQAYRARLNEQRAQAAMRQQAARVYQQSEQDRVLAINREMERQRAAELAESYLPTAEDRSRAFWNSWRTNSTASSAPPRPSPRIDYWRSYDRTNTSGNYVTSSGAVTNCRLGSGSC